MHCLGINLGKKKSEFQVTSSKVRLWFLRCFWKPALNLLVDKPRSAFRVYNASFYQGER